MLSRFYQRQSRVLLALVILSFPYFYFQAQSIRNNNDIETWLPQESDVRKNYEQFKKDFGVEEVILIGLDSHKVTPELIESVCRRVERLPGVRQCWSPQRFQAKMAETLVPHAESEKRLRGLAIAENGRMVGVVVLMSQYGLKDRAATVRDINAELHYCHLRGNEICLAGAPVICVELDRLGGQQENQKFFLLTLAISVCLLYYWLREWKLTLSIMGLTLWAIQLTIATIGMMGGEMNFILGALPVMVMIFTLEAAIHVEHYHKTCLRTKDPVGEALKLSLKPCAMSMATTAIGLFSVSVTDILPVTQFGMASAWGAVVAMLTGLCITPALLTVIKHSEDTQSSSYSLKWPRLATAMLARSKTILTVSAVLVVISFVGLFRVETKIDPLGFLPKDGRVSKDVLRVQQELTNIDSIEAVVTFPPSADDNSVLEQMVEVKKIEQILQKHPCVRHTMSAATFLPDPLPTGLMARTKLLNALKTQKSTGEFVTVDRRQWRISARINVPADQSISDVHRELERMVVGEPVRLTGIAPMLEQAQLEIFDGFWKSFTSALAVIFVVMAITLRSIRMALLAILPNLAPICIVFGTLGWIGYPVDIGMMMTGSIALGITVDGTFHFLVRYHELETPTRDRMQAVRAALLTSGGPIFESIVVSSLAMLALGLSSFAPTVRFGVLMAILLMAALFGGLALLPAMLCLAPGKKQPAKQEAQLPIATDRVA